MVQNGAGGWENRNACNDAKMRKKEKERKGERRWEKTHRRNTAQRKNTKPPPQNPSQLKPQNPSEPPSAPDIGYEQEAHHTCPSLSGASGRL
jgi:hypothetical protein